ncbi:metallophosphoesterase family protein [Paenibacillus cremeus]|uniref:DNA repair exonuclease n=1 Tax=Paenibacillus cremeus TaxID=2163881 RepID=A0A559K834_9BACL|nr:DNA repair exonuclease [Paenibacillus cremeus]TVY08290.1 DNA repair exonuclease [Paenibacillus cremeus]
MRAFRFVHAADLHLDSPFRGLVKLPESLRERLRESTFQALDRLVQLAVRERADFIVISGDVYDIKDRSLRAQLRFCQALETLAGHQIPAFVIHGNHDPMKDGYAAKLRYPEGTRVFGCEKVESHVVMDAEGKALCRVSGISFGQAVVTENLTPGFRRWDDGLYHIGLLHTNVDGDPQHDNYAPCSLKDLNGRGVDYWALGHVHTRQIVQERPWVVYPGNPQGRHIRETGARGCYLVDVTAGGETTVQFHALDEVRWQEQSVSIAGLTTEQELKETLEEAVEAAREVSEGRPALLRVTLTGRGELHPVLQRAGVKTDLAALLWEAEKHSQRNAVVWIESIHDQTGALVDRGHLAAQPGFLGDLLRLAEEAGMTSEQLDSFATEAFAVMAGQPMLASLLQGMGTEELAAWLQEAEELAMEALSPELKAESGWTG